MRNKLAVGMCIIIAIAIASFAGYALTNDEKLAGALQQGILSSIDPNSEALYESLASGIEESGFEAMEQPAFETVFSNGFEDSPGTGLYGFNTSAWEVAYGTDMDETEVQTLWVHSGNYAAHMEEGDEGDVSITTKAGLIGLSSYDECNLSFWIMHEAVEAGDTSYLDIYDGSWHYAVKNYNGDISGTSWKYQSINISAYNLDEPNFQARWRAEFGDDKDELYLDDISIICLESSKNYTNVTVNTSITDADGNEVNATITVIDPETGEPVNCSCPVENKTYDITIELEDQPVENITIEGALLKDNSQVILIDTPENLNQVQAFAINPLINFTSGKVTAVAKGNELYKCKDWEFEARVCHGEWQKIMDIIPGEPYTFNITPVDPAYSEGIKLKIALICATAGCTDANTDIPLKDYMNLTLGHNVTTFIDTNTAWNTSKYNVAVISESVTSGNVGWLKGNSIGILTLEGSNWDEFGLGTSGDSAGGASTIINITDNTHYITQIYSIGLKNVSASSANAGYISGWSNDVKKLAHYSANQSRAKVLAAAKAGTLADSTTAAGRRVFFGAQYFNNLNTNGKALFSRALDWAGSVEGMPPIIKFVSQAPADIGTFTLFGKSLNITYNITDNVKVNASTVKLYYKTNASYSSCLSYANGSIVNCGYRGIAKHSNTSQLWKWLLYDNEVYPGVYSWPNERQMELTPHLSHLLDSASKGIKIRLYNVSSSKKYGAFEVMANNTSPSGTSSLRVYYCNSTYVSGDITVNANCVNFYNVPGQTKYNHSHSAYSKHLLIPFAVNTTSGKLGNVRVTSTSYFVLLGRPGANSWQAWYIPNVTRPATIQTSSNLGAAWSNFAGTVDSHLHQYNGSERIWYYACANDTTGNGNCSTARSDLLDLGGLPPTSPAVYSPATGAYYGSIQISYTAAQSPNGYAISYYNITLVTLNETFVKGINPSTTSLSYLWNSLGTTAGNYKIKVKACDTTGQCSSGYSANITITSTDTNPPIINSITDSPDPINQSKRIKITANVTDNIKVSSVWVKIAGINYTMPPFNYTYSSKMNFYDNFETGTFAAKGWVSEGAYTNWIVYNINSPNGTYSAYCEPAGGLEYLIVNISTIGYKNINVSYTRRDSGLDAPSEYCGSEWYNGTAWAELDNAVTGFTVVSRKYSLPASANNNTKFRLRFKVNAGSTNEKCWIDEVKVLGTKIAPPPGIYNYSYNTSNLPGGINYYTVYANDTSGNLASKTGNFTVKEYKAPRVFGLMPIAGSVYTSFSLIQIAANATDFSGVSSVRANITYPNGTKYIIPLAYAAGAKYNASFAIPYLAGRYNITIIANDTVGNVNRTEKTYFIASLVSDLPPTSNSPNDKTYDIGADAIIAWVLQDDFAPGKYYVKRNGILYAGPSSWQNGTNIIIKPNTYFTGIWNYTIYYNDSYGNNGVPDTVAITIADNSTPSCSELSGNGYVPLLKTIKIDGNMSDWDAVLANPLNYMPDLSSGAGDLDAVSNADRDLVHFAYTWNSTHLFFNWRRPVSGTNQLAVLAYIDFDNDRHMNSTDKVIKFGWSGSNRQYTSDLYNYVPSSPSGDYMNGSGHDMPGSITVNKSIAAGIIGGSIAGIELETEVKWSDLWINAPKPLTIQPASAGGAGTNLPSQVEDNVNVVHTGYSSLLFKPDRQKSGINGSSVYYDHDLMNCGLETESISMSKISSKGFNVTLYYPNGSLVAGNVYLKLYNYTTIIAKVEIPKNATFGTVETTTITAAIPQHNYSRNVQDTTSIGSITISPSSRIVKGSAGTNLTLNYTVTNFQGFSDVLELSLSSTKPWVHSVHYANGTAIYDTDSDSHPDIGSVLPGDSKTVLLKIYIPSNATLMENDLTTIRVNSSVSASVTITATASATVYKRVQIEPDYEGSAGPGGSIFYLMTVTNSWSSADVIDIAYTTAAGYSVSLFKQDKSTLLTDTDIDLIPDTGSLSGSGGEYKLYVRVITPTGAPTGASGITTLYANSSIKPSSYDTAKINTSVQTIVTYADAARSVQKSIFEIGDTVYGRAHGLAGINNVYFEWINPNGSLRRTSTTIPVSAEDNADDTFYTNTSLALGNWTVIVFNSQNNAIIGSNIFILRDSKKPKITLNFPTDNYFKNSSSIKFNWTATDNHDKFLNCSLRINGIINASNINSPSGIQAAYTVSGFNDGVYYWNVSCFDDSGNYNTSATRKFTIDTKKPNVALNFPPNNYNTTSGTIRFNWTATNGIDPILQCNLTVDGIVKAIHVNSPAGFPTTSLVIGMNDGVHYWNVTCRDDTGNTNTSATRKFIIDSKAPSVRGIFPYANSVFNETDSIAVGANITDGNFISSAYARITLPNGTKINVSLSASGSNYSYFMPPKGLIGMYNVTIIAKDNFGNINSTSKSYFIVSAQEFTLDVVDRRWKLIEYTETTTPLGGGMYNIRINPMNSSIKEINVVSHSQNSSKWIIRMDYGTYDEIEKDNFIKSFAIDLSYLNYTSANYTFTAEGYHLFKCTTDYNFTSQSCYRMNYTQVLTGLIPGQNYTFIYNSTDPGFGETLQGPANTSDSYMRSQLANNNYGGAEFISVGRGIAANLLRGIIQFNLSHIPSGVVIGSANLSLYFYEIPAGDALGNRTHGVYKVQQSPARPWKELQVTWNSYNTTGAWTAGGGDYAATPSDTNIFSSAELNTWIVYNVTADVQSFVSNPTLNFGWVIKDTTEDTSRITRNYRSSEYTNSSLWPKLEISYTDAQAPSITLNFPPYNYTTNMSSITFNWTATDNIDPILQCNLTINGTVYGANVNSPNGTPANYTVTGLMNGYYLWNVTCWDDDYNTNTSQTRNFTVASPFMDNTAPSIALNFPSNYYNTSSNSINFNWTATDDYDSVPVCNLTVDGANYANINSPNATPTNYTVLGLSDGVHYWNVTCWDNFGNTNTSETRQFTIDSTKPSIVLNFPPNSYYTNVSAINFNWTATDNIDPILQCNLTINGTVYGANVNSPNATPTNYTVSSLSDGTYYWNVTCWDNLGNTNTSETRTFTINTTGAAVPLSVIIISPTANKNYTQANAVNITANVTDDIAIHTVRALVQWGAGSQIITLNPIGGSQYYNTFSQTYWVGRYNITILANNTLGETNNSQKTYFNVKDITPPTIKIIQPANGTKYSLGQNITIKVNATDPYWDNVDAVYANVSIPSDGYQIVPLYEIGNTQVFQGNFTNTSYFGIYNFVIFANDTFSNYRKAGGYFSVVEAVQIISGIGCKLTETPQVAESGEKVLFQADLAYLDGTPALQGNVSQVNLTIYYINSTNATVVKKGNMAFLQNGVWYYEWDAGANDNGNYMGVTQIQTNEVPPRYPSCSALFTISGRGVFKIAGISPDLVNINETIRLATEVTFNGEPVDSSKLANPQLWVVQINGSTQYYNLSSGLSVSSGLIYLDGTFDQTGVYYLNWTVEYYNRTKNVQEIVVAKDWDQKLDNISVGGGLQQLIIENKQKLIEVLNEMERQQDFSAEEIFLVTDAVNSMTKVANMLADGDITEEDAQEAMNRIHESLENKMGGKITGKLTEIFGDNSIVSGSSTAAWSLGLLFAVLIVIILAVRGKTARTSQQDSGRKRIVHRRYELLLSRISIWLRNLRSKSRNRQFGPEKNVPLTRFFERKKPSETQATIYDSISSGVDRMRMKIKHDAFAPRKERRYEIALHKIGRKIQEHRKEKENRQYDITQRRIQKELMARKAKPEEIFRPSHDMQNSQPRINAIAKKLKNGMHEMLLRRKAMKGVHQKKVVEGGKMHTKMKAKDLFAAIDKYKTEEGVYEGMITEARESLDSEYEKGARAAVFEESRAITGLRNAVTAIREAIPSQKIADIASKVPKPSIKMPNVSMPKIRMPNIDAHSRLMNAGEGIKAAGNAIKSTVSSAVAHGKEILKARDEEKIRQKIADMEPSIKVEIKAEDVKKKIEEGKKEIKQRAKESKEKKLMRRRYQVVAEKVKKSVTRNHRKGHLELLKNVVDRQNAAERVDSVERQEKRLENDRIKDLAWSLGQKSSRIGKSVISKAFPSENGSSTFQSSDPEVINMKLDKKQKLDQLKGLYEK